MSDLRVKRGDSIKLALGPILDQYGNVQNITGATIRFTAKAKLSDLDAAAVITGSTADGRVTIPSGADGRAYVNIPGTATAGFTRDRVLHWDVQLFSGGDTVTIDEGVLYVKRDVTLTP